MAGARQQRGMNRRQVLARLGALAAVRAASLTPGAAAAAAAGAGAPAATAPTRGDLRGDIAILRLALGLHPGLYRYAAPGVVEARIDRLEAAYVAAPGLAARYLALSRFLATIRCGHSYCNFFNQRKAVASALFDRPTRLPFRFAWIGSRMIVTDDFHPGDGAGNRGAERKRGRSAFDPGIAHALRPGRRP